MIMVGSIKRQLGPDGTPAKRLPIGCLAMMTGLSRSDDGTIQQDVFAISWIWFSVWTVWAAMNVVLAHLVPIFSIRGVIWASCVLAVSLAVVLLNRRWWLMDRPLIGIGLNGVVLEEMLTSSVTLSGVRVVYVRKDLDPGWEEAFQGEARILVLALDEAGMIWILDLDDAEYPVDGWYWRNLYTPLPNER